MKTIKQLDGVILGLLQMFVEGMLHLLVQRFSLWIVGNAAALKQNSNWAALLSDAKIRQVYFRVKYPYVFKEDVTTKTSKLTSLVPGSSLDKATVDQASTGMNAGHRAIPRASELVCGNTKPRTTVQYEPVSSKRREAMGFRQRPSQPREVEKAPFLVKKRSFGTRSIERDSVIQLQQTSERRMDCAVDESRMQRKNSISTGERNTDLCPTETRTGDDKDRTRRSHPDSFIDLAHSKRGDGNTSVRVQIPQSKDVALPDSSSWRKTDADPRRERSNTKKINERLAEDTRGGPRKASASVICTTPTDQDPDAPSPRARLKVSSVDGKNEYVEKSSSMKAIQSSAAEGIGCDRSHEVTLERSRPIAQNCDGIAASLLTSRQRTASTPDSEGGAPSSRNDDARWAPGRSRHSSHNAPTMRTSEWDRYTRTLDKDRHAGSSRERVRDRIVGFLSSDSDRRTNQSGRAHLDAPVRQGGRCDSDFRTEDAGKYDSDYRTSQSGKRDPDRNIDRRNTHPPTKKQKTAGGSSVAQNGASASTVDDILSGLGNLSRSQVVGSRAIDEPFSVRSTSHRL